MKKSILTMAILAMTSTMAFAGNYQKCDGPQGCPPPPPGMHQPGQRPPKIDLDKKLKLTEAQKAKAKAMRMQTREQMEPIMNAIRTKQEQKEIIKHSQKLTTEAQLEQTERLNKQIFELKKQARDLRMQNERDFESILTDKQKKEFSKIKENAKKNMAKNKHPHKR